MIGIVLLALAAEAAAFSAPAGWVRADVDATHGAIAPHVRTVEAWVPEKRSSAKDELYYAVGDGGIALAAFVAEIKAALPAGAVVSEDKAVTLCDGQAGRYLAFATPTLAVEEIVAVTGDIAAAARYERTAGSGEDPRARASVDGLCPQAETPPSDGR
ncbi:MAG TPA: hypothetical protein VIG46_10530 [Candidatus Baltobacteraceae bacterium]